MSSSTPMVLITGANTGLGFETVRSLFRSQKTYTILLGGRSLDKANAAVDALRKEFPASKSTVQALQIDIEDDLSISKAFETVEGKFGRLDVLVNNAGTQLEQQMFDGKLSMRELWTRSYEVNTTSTQLMTQTFIPLLLKSSDPRLLFLTSGTSTLTNHGTLPLPVDTCPPAGWPKKEGFGLPAYRSSKAGMNMMMLEWMRLLKNDNVKIWCVSPGYLATGLGGDAEKLKKAGAGDPAVGADFIRDVVEGKKDADVGKVVSTNGIQPW